MTATASTAVRSSALVSLRELEARVESTETPVRSGVGGVVLSLFPGLGLLDRAFEAEGFCVVRGPDVLWGADVKRFHAPAGVFAGIIGGPPCQPFSQLVHMVRANGFEPRHENLIPEYERIVGEAQPLWWLMEEVPAAPVPAVEGYKVRSQLLNNRWCGGTQNRVRRISFGTRDGSLLPVDTVALDPLQWDFAVCGDTRTRPVKLGGSGKEKGGKTSSLNRGGGSLPLAEMCRLQGVPEGFLDESPFTEKAKKQMIGNGVPFSLGCALAKGVRSAMVRWAAGAGRGADSACEHSAAQKANGELSSGGPTL